MNGITFYADVVVDKERRWEVFVENHGSRIGGHSGESKTIDKIREKFFWPGMYKDLITWVSIFTAVSLLNMLYHCIQQRFSEVTLSIFIQVDCSYSTVYHF